MSVATELSIFAWQLLPSKIFGCQSGPIDMSLAITEGAF